MIWTQIMGHKGSDLRPGCIGTDRARTELLFYFDGKIKNCC